MWDAAGQKHFEKIRGMYYRDAKGALLCFDVNNPVSFKNLNSWVEELDENVGRKVPVLLVGNKIDLERRVKEKDAIKYAKKNNIPSEPFDLVTNKDVTEMISKEITEFLAKKYGGYEIPKKFVYAEQDFTLENGMLTQTMKLKRRAVVKEFKKELDKLYK